MTDITDPALQVYLYEKEKEKEAPPPPPPPPPDVEDPALVVALYEEEKKREREPSPEPSPRPSPPSPDITDPALRVALYEAEKEPEPWTVEARPPPPITGIPSAPLVTGPPPPIDYGTATTVEIDQYIKDYLTSLSDEELQAVAGGYKVGFDWGTTVIKSPKARRAAIELAAKMFAEKEAPDIEKTKIWRQARYELGRRGIVPLTGTEAEYYAIPRGKPTYMSAEAWTAAQKRRKAYMEKKAYAETHIPGETAAEWKARTGGLIPAASLGMTPLPMGEVPDAQKAYGDYVTASEAFDDKWGSYLRETDEGLRYVLETDRQVTQFEREQAALEGLRGGLPYTEEGKIDVFPALAGGVSPETLEKFGVTGPLEDMAKVAAVLGAGGLLTIPDIKLLTDRYGVTETQRLLSATGVAGAASLAAIAPYVKPDDTVDMEGLIDKYGSRRATAILTAAGIEDARGKVSDVAQRKLVVKLPPTEVPEVKPAGGVAGWWRGVTPWKEEEGETFGSFLGAAFQPAKSWKEVAWGLAPLPVWSFMPSKVTGIPEERRLIGQAGTALATVVAAPAALGLRGIAPITRLVMKTGATTIGVSGAVGMGYGLTHEPVEIDVKSYQAIDLSIVGTEEGSKPLRGYMGPPDAEGRRDVDYSGLVDAGYSEAEIYALLAQAGTSPTIPLEVYRELSPEFQKLYTPGALSMAYEPGILGAYGRGAEFVTTPARWLQERGPAGQLAGGMYQYMVPHGLVSELYPQKGGVAFTSLIPHFGPTAVYPFVAGAPGWQKAMGIGFAALPYFVGPMGSGARWAGAKISRVPVLGTGLKVATAPLRWGAELVRPVTAGFERIAPWQAAYTLGRAIPKYGPWAYQKGWLGSRVPYSKIRQEWMERPALGPRQLEAPTAAELKARAIKLDEALKRAGLTREEASVDWYDAPIYERGKIVGFEKTPSIISYADLAKQPPPPSWMETGTAIIKPRGTYTWQWGAPSISAPIVQQLPSWFHTSPIATLVRSTMPRVAMTAAVVAPIAAAPIIMPAVAPAFMPVMAPVISIEQQIVVIDSMIEKGQITEAQAIEMARQIRLVQEQELTQRQVQVQVQEVVSEVLTEQQQVQHQQQVQQRVQQQQQTVQQIVQQQGIQQRFQQQIQQHQQVQQNFQIQFQQQLFQQQPWIQESITPIIPPIIPPPPFLPGVPSLGKGVGAARRPGVGKKELGAWLFRGHPVFGVHPLTGKMVGGMALREEVQYGAVERRKPPKVSRGAKTGILSSRISGSSGPVINTGRQYVPTYKGA